MGRQLALNLRLRDESSFENFQVGRNRELLEQLRRLVTNSPNHQPLGFTLVYIWGEPGSGKTHLLESLCRAGHSQGMQAAYIPLQEKNQLSPAMLEGLEHTPLLCIDDMQAVAQASDWETGVFALYERLRHAGGTLVVAGVQSPGRLNLGLADLTTRLAAGLVYPVHTLGDAEKIAALRLRARNRGLDLPEEVARYVLARYPRDSHALFALLDRIDQAALAAQRRITIPFLRSLEIDNSF